MASSLDRYDDIKSQRRRLKYMEGWDLQQYIRKIGNLRNDLQAEKANASSKRFLQINDQMADLDRFERDAQAKLDERNARHRYWTPESN